MVSGMIRSPGNLLRFVNDSVNVMRRQTIIYAFMGATDWKALKRLGENLSLKMVCQNSEV